MSQLMHRLELLISLFLGVSVLALPTFASSAQSSDTLAELETGKLVTAREQLRGYVLDIKEKYKPTEAEYRDARRLYRNAASEYAGWISSLKMAIHRGNTKDLRKDEGYQHQGDTAGLKGKACIAASS